MELDFKAIARSHRNMLDKYSSRDRYAKISKKGSPLPLNHKNDPYSLFKNGCRHLALCYPKKILGHFHATKANKQSIFHVNWPHAPIFMLAWDVDCKTGIGTPERAQAYAAQINAEVFRGRAWIEPSRNLAGRYPWIKVRRAPGETVKVFKANLLQFNRHMAAIYPHQKNNNGVGHDGTPIKGAPWHRYPNPEFYEGEGDYDDRWFLLDCISQDHNEVPVPLWMAQRTPRDIHQIYDWHKRHYRFGKFYRIASLERGLLHAGTLITSPLHGLALRPDPAGTLASFNAWEQDDSVVIDSRELWSLIPALAPEGQNSATSVIEIEADAVDDWENDTEVDDDRDDGSENEGASHEPGGEQGKKKKYTIVCNTSPEGRGKPTPGCGIADVTGCAFTRMLRVGKNLSQHLGRAANEQELLETYAVIHRRPATPARIDRAAKVAQWLLENFDPDKCGAGFSSRREALLEVIKRHVKPEFHFDPLTGKPLYRRTIHDLDLAVTLFAIEQQKKRGSSVAGIIAMFRKLKAGGAIPRLGNPHLVGACKKILIRAVLIREVAGYIVGFRGIVFSKAMNHDQYDPTYLPQWAKPERINFVQ